MNTLLAPQRSSAPPDSLRTTPPVPRPSLADRIAMRVGLRLLLWSTRAARRVRDHELCIRRYRVQEETARRERAHLRETLLVPRL